MSNFDHLPRAQRDALTDLPNRLALKDCLDEAITQSPGGFAVLELDLDGFKDLNDTFGHPEGDEYLRNIAEILDEILRDADSYLLGLPARTGGDEFTIILNDIKTDDVVDTIRKRIQTILSDHGIETSIGGRRHQTGESIEELLVSVDHLMYLDKKERKKAQYESDEARKAIGQIALLAVKHNISLRDLPILAEIYASGELGPKTAPDEGAVS